MKYSRRLLAAIMLLAMTTMFVAPCECLKWITRLQVLPAIWSAEIVIVAAIIILTVLGGRVYCAVICPLGILQDWVRMFTKWLPVPTIKMSKSIRYALLAMAILGSTVGTFGVIDPYGIFGRFWAAGVFGAAEAVAMRVWSIALLAVILLMTTLRTRWWCNQVCPVGTALGLISHWAVFRVRVENAKCVGCGRCVNACDIGAIELKQGKASVDNSMCVACYKCSALCKAIKRQPMKGAK